MMAPMAALAQWVVDNPDYVATGLPGAPIYIIIRNAMYWILGIFGFIGIIGFAVSGIMYLTSAGNEKQVETAKKAMLMSIVGIIVGLVGFVVINAVDSALGGIEGF